MKLVYGSPGIMMLFIEVPKPKDDRIGDDTESQNYNPKIWTPFSSDMGSFWTILSDDEANCIRKTMIEKYKFKAGGEDNIDDTKLTYEELANWTLFEEHELELKK